MAQGDVGQAGGEADGEGELAVVGRDAHRGAGVDERCSGASRSARKVLISRWSRRP